MRSGGTDGVIDVTFNDAQMAILAWSPTTIPYNQIEHAPAHRNSQEIFFVGVKERLDPYAVFPFVWRRVVFWTHQRFEQFRTIEDWVVPDSDLALRTESQICRLSTSRS